MAVPNTTTQQFIENYDISCRRVQQLLSDIVKAVRADKVVGEGTCSWIDEAHTDYELLELVALDVDDNLLTKIPTVKQAVEIAIDTHNLLNEREEEIRNA